MDDETLDALIGFWQRNQGIDAELLRHCVEITARLASRLPAAELLAMREDPARHRTRLQAALAELPASTSRSRDLARAPAESSSPGRLAGNAGSASAGAPAADSPPTIGVPREQRAFDDGGWDRAAPTSIVAGPGAIVAHQEMRGDGGVAFNVGAVQGGLRVQVPTPRTKPGEPAAQRPAQFAAPVRILFLGANPLDSTRLRLDEEVREIDRVLVSAELGRRFELCQKWAVRTGELQGHLLRTKPHVVHFSGHGSRENAIFLESEDGRSLPVPAPRLARLLAQFNQRLRCVVLNACYSEEQATAIAEHIDCVIGMSTAVADRAAIRFAAAFYQAVAYGRSVRDAYEQGCADLDLAELGQQGVPRLIAVRRDPGTVILAESTP
jgi:hypothetical protein